MPKPPPPPPPSALRPPPCAPPQLYVASLRLFGPWWRRSRPPVYDGERRRREVSARWRWYQPVGASDFDQGTVVIPQPGGGRVRLPMCPSASFVTAPTAPTALSALFNPTTPATLRRHHHHPLPPAHCLHSSAIVHLAALGSVSAIHRHPPTDPTSPPQTLSAPTALSALPTHSTSSPPSLTAPFTPLHWPPLLRSLPLSALGSGAQTPSTPTALTVSALPTHLVRVFQSFRSI